MHHNFANDNTITAVCDQLADLKKILGAERELSVNWFRKNEMVVNSDKFQAITLNRKKAQATRVLSLIRKLKQQTQ